MLGPAATTLSINSTQILRNDEIKGGKDQHGQNEHARTGRRNARQAEVTDVSHRVLRGPDNRIHHELELRCRDREKGIEAVRVGDSEKLEEGDSVSANARGRRQSQ